MVSEKREMSSSSHTVVMPPCQHGTVAVFVEVPFSDRRNACDDIAEAYAVEVGEDIPGGCIIWGRYHGKWNANVSGRWLISRFIRGCINPNAGESADIENKIKKFEAAYYPMHCTCPKCGGDCIQKGSGGYVFNDIELVKDDNFASCECGWSGIVHDLVPTGVQKVTLPDVRRGTKSLKKTGLFFNDHRFD